MPGTYVLRPGDPGAPGGPGGPAAPNAGAGWEIGVFGADSGYSQLLAMIPASVWTSLTFTKMLDDQGSGTLVMSMDGPFWAGPNLTNGSVPHFLLDEEHVWRVFQDGIPRFEFLGETITEQLIDPSEKRLATVTGPGTIAALAWADAMPPGFPSAIVYKTDALNDSFSEVDVSGNYVVDYGLWNASAPHADISINPAGSIRLQATSGGTILGSTTWDATNSLLSANVTTITSPDPNNVTLNGSQLTQMYVQDTSGTGYYALMGLSATSLYAQYSGPDGTFTQVIATFAQYQAGQGNNAQYSHWQISEADGTFYFWVSSDGQTWKLVWNKPRHWDASKTGVYFSATYTGSTAEFATISSLNSNVSTSSLGGATYLSQPIISVWLQTLAAAKSRGTIPFVTSSASSSTDSFGNPWADSQSVQIQNGTDLYSLLQGHCQMVDADYIMEPGFRLVVGLPSATTPNTGQVTLGYDRSSTVRFYEAGGQVTKQRQRLRSQIQNLIAVINGDGRTVTASNSGSIATWLQREGWVQAASQVTSADISVVASTAVQQSASETLSWTMQITPNQPGRTVFRDFGVGDWIGLERPDYSAVDAVRVNGIAVSVDENGNETHELTLVSYIQWLEQRLQYITTKMGGGFLSANGTTAISGNAQGSTLKAPTVFSPTLTSLGAPNGSPGGAPLVFNPATGNWVLAGSTDPQTGSEVPLAVSGASGSATVGQAGIIVTSPSVGTALNPNPDFTGGSLATWQGVNATVASVTPAAGLPSQSFAAQITPASSSTALLQTSLPLIPVQAGQQYTLFAQANLPTQADMHATTQVAWEDSNENVLRTDTLSTIIPAGQWVQLSYQVQAPGPAYDSQVVSDGPGAWWKLSDAVASPTAKDSSGFGWTGTATSVTFGSSFTPVPGNTCAAFNGTTSKITTSYHPLSFSQLSVEAWVNLNGLSQSGFPRVIANSFTDSDNCGFQLHYNGTNRSVLFSLGNGTSQTTVTSATGAIPATGWTHLAATWDGATVLLYVNGVAAAAGSFTGPVAPGKASGAGIGFNPTYSGDFVNGLIGEVAVYPTALVPAAVALRAANLATPGAGAGASQAAIAVGPTVGVIANPMQVADVKLVQGAPTIHMAGTSSVTASGTTVTDSAGNTRIIAGLQSDGTITTVDVNGPAPNQPDTPTVASIPGGIAVSWDGLLAGGAPLSDFDSVQFHVSAVNGFTPTTATMVYHQPAAGTVPALGLVPGTTYYAKLVAINKSGNTSVPSAQASIAAGFATATLIGNLGVLNPNPYFMGGDTSGWTAVNGSFALATGAGLPAGSPFAYAGKYTGGPVAGYMAESGGQFAITPGQQFLITAWVYSTGQVSPASLSGSGSLRTSWRKGLSESAALSGSGSLSVKDSLSPGMVPIDVGFGWTSGGSDVSSSVATFAVETGAWTQVTAVLTAPSSGVNGAYPRIGSAYAGVVVYAEAILCLPQVPGGLIQAGTITAAQIAAGVVVAGIIDGTTITGVTVNAGTFNGTNWIENAHGQFIYSGPPALGNMIMSMTPAGGTDGFGNSYSFALSLYGAGSSTAAINLFTRDSHETTPGKIYTASSGGGTGIYLELSLASPIASNTFFGNSSLVLFSESSDGSAPATAVITSLSEADSSQLNVATASNLFYIQGGTIGSLNYLIQLSFTLMSISVALNAVAGTSTNPTLISTDGWTTITSFSTGFQAGSPAPQYALEPVGIGGSVGNVRLRGQVIANATNAADAAMFSVPYTFARNQDYVTPTNASGYSAGNRVVRVASSGTIRLEPSSSNTNFVLLDGIVAPRS